eukprot:2740077-Rhodomonas_salina.3
MNISCFCLSLPGVAWDGNSTRALSQPACDSQARGGSIAKSAGTRRHVQVGWGCVMLDESGRGKQCVVTGCWVWPKKLCCCCWLLGLAGESCVVLLVVGHSSVLLWGVVGGKRCGDIGVGEREQTMASRQASISSKQSNTMLCRLTSHSLAHLAPPTHGIRVSRRK